MKQTDLEQAFRRFLNHSASSAVGVASSIATAASNQASQDATNAVTDHATKTTGVHGAKPGQYLAITSRGDQRIGVGDIVGLIDPTVFEIDWSAVRLGATQINREVFDSARIPIADNGEVSSSKVVRANDSRIANVTHVTGTPSAGRVASWTDATTVGDSGIAAAVATQSAAGFLSAVDKTLIDRSDLARRGFSTPTDDFDTFSGWTWAGSPFNDAPSTVDTTSFPSHVSFVHDSVSENHFCYQGGSTTVRVLRARLFKGMQSYIGLRLSNSDESAYIEIRLEDSAAATGLLRLARYQNGIADAVLVDYITPGYVILELGATSTGGFWYGAFTTNTPLTVAIGSGGWATTITRWGITFGQRGYASDYARACGIDWFLIAG